MIIFNNLKSFFITFFTLVIFVLSTTIFGTIHPHLVVLVAGSFAIGYLNPKGGFYYCCTLGILLFIVLYFIDNNTIKVITKSSAKFACYLGLLPCLAGGLLGKFIKNTFKKDEDDH